MAHNGAFAWNHWSVLTPTIWGNLSKTCLVMMNLNANGNLTAETNYIRDLAKLPQIEGKNSQPEHIGTTVYETVI